MMTASDPLTAPAALNPFHSKDAPQPPNDSVPAYSRSPPSSSSQGNYSSLPTVDQLEFQNIAHTGSQGTISVDIPSASDSLPGSSSSSHTLRDASSPSPSSSASAANAPFYSLNYYKPYFDITTDVLFSRMFRAVNPSSTTLYTDDASPDLYGPFWITTTLCLLLAICSNLASYIDYKTADRVEGDDDRGEWKYDFRTLTVSVSVFYSLITWVPLVFYVLLRPRRPPARSGGAHLHTGVQLQRAAGRVCDAADTGRAAAVDGGGGRGGHSVLVCGEECVDGSIGGGGDADRHSHGGYTGGVGTVIHMVRAQAHTLNARPPKRCAQAS